jgi:AbrB family looped-hinge helix DNA binding protein
MPTIVKIQRKGQVTIPNRLRNQAGIADGDLIEAVFSRGRIILTPRVAVDRSKLPSTDDEYTSKQRRIIDAGKAEGLEDFKAGRSHGPFASAREASAYIERMAKKLANTKRPKRLVR